MANSPTNAQTRSNRDQHGERVRDTEHVAWYAMRDGEMLYTDQLDTPVYVGEVYELVSVMLNHAPFDFSFLDAECTIEVTNQRAWPGLLNLVLHLFEDAPRHEEARSV